MSKEPAHTHPQVFILESSHFEDEAKNLQDGLLLFQSLALYGNNPIYYYFRTEKKLVHLAEVFRKSKYRYLHLSCHGSNSTIETTLDSIPYVRVADILADCLNNKRLFVSACEVGNDAFATTIKATNPGLYSVLAPCTKIAFNRSAAFWSTFYFLMFDFGNEKMKLATIKDRLSRIVTLFKVHLHLSWNSAHERIWASMVFHPKAGITDVKHTKGN